MKKRLIILIMLIAALWNGGAMMRAQQPFGGSQDVQAYTPYRSTIYAPGATGVSEAPESAYPYGNNGGPANAPAGPHRAITPGGGQTTQPGDGGGEGSPIGAPWILLLFAVAYLGWRVVRAKNQLTINLENQTTNNTMKKNNINLQSACDSFRQSPDGRPTVGRQSSVNRPWVSRGSSVGRLSFTNALRNLCVSFTHRSRLVATLLLLVTMSIGQVWATDVVSDGTAKMYINMKAVEWWPCGTDFSANHVYFFKGDNGQFAGNGTEKISDNLGCVTIPAGTWDHCILLRGKSNTANWDVYNKTGDIELSGKNYLTIFAENQTTSSWDVYVPETPCEELVLFVYCASGTPKLHAWDGNVSTGSWPGTSLTPVAGNANWYKYEFATKPTGNFLLNTDGDNNKTSNMSFSGYSLCKCWNYVKSENLTINNECPTLCDAPSNGNISGTTSYFIGQNISLTASATGDGLSYQWKKNGSDMAGKTSATLTINSCSVSDAGTYSCVISNSCGSVTPSTTVSVESPAAQNITIYYSNPNSWSEVHYHNWGQSGNTTWGSCPKIEAGDQVVINCTTYYKVVVDIANYPNILFLNDGGNNSSSKTGDITLTADKNNQYYDGSNWAALPANTTFSVNCASGTGYTVTNLQKGGAAYTSGTKSVVCGDVITFTVNRTSGYEITSVKVAGTDVYHTGANYTYTTNGTSDVTVNIVATKTLQPNVLNWTTTPANGYVGGTQTIAASATHGTPVYTSSNPSVATVADNVITFVAPGTTTIKANCAAHDDYLAAAEISQNITVTGCYLQGRITTAAGSIEGGWDNSNPLTILPFTYNTANADFELATGKTVAELTKNATDQWFHVAMKNTSWTSYFYGNQTLGAGAENTPAGTKISKSGSGTNNVRFNNNNDLSANVIIHFDPTNGDIWYTATAPDSHNASYTAPANGTITLNDAATTPISVAQGATYTVKVTPNTGYEVSSIQMNGGSDVKSSFTKTDGVYSKTVTMRAADEAWTATMSACTYTIEYKDKGGATFSGTHASGYPRTHTYGTATQLKGATKAGYTFDGWFTSSDCTGAAITELGATAYTADITLYAKWTSSAVIYDHLSAVRTPEAAADAPTISDISVAQGGYVTVTAKAANNGYLFNGWTSDKGTFGNANSMTTTFTPDASNAVATANYRVATATLTIYVKATGAPTITSGNYYINGEQQGMLNGRNITSKTDCTNEDWYALTLEADEVKYLHVKTNSCTQSTAIQSTEDIYLDCTGKVTRQVDASEYCKSNDVKVYVYSPDCKPGLKAQWTDGSGYKSLTGGKYSDMTSVGGGAGCEGWYETIFNQDGLKSVQIELGIYFSNTWRKHSVNNTWTTVNAGGVVYWDASALCGDNESAPSATDERPCEAAITYNVTYNVNGGSGAAVPTQAATVKGGEFPVASYTGTKSGFTFGGWNDGSKVYLAGSTYTMPAKDVVFTAVWNATAASSEWYLAGANCGGWSNSAATWALNMSYRGSKDIFYRQVNFNDLGDWFKLTKNDNHYYAETGSGNKTYTEYGINHPISIVENDTYNGGSMKFDPAGDKLVWAVMDQKNNKFWVEDVHAYNTVHVTVTGGDHGTYTLRTVAAPVIEATQYAIGESYTLTVTAAEGFMATITVDGQAVDVKSRTEVDGDRHATIIYTYTGKMGDKDQEVVITYATIPAMTVYIRKDVAWSAEDGFEPMIQWNTENGEHWNGWDYVRRLQKLPGYKDWYSYTFPQSANVLTWQVKNGKVAYNNPDGVNHSGQQQITVGDESFCYAVTETTMSDYSNQREIIKASCPEVMASLEVHGGTVVGGYATLTATSALKTDWVSGYAVEYKYCYQKDGHDDWTEIAADGEGAYKLLIDQAVTYTYKVEVCLKQGGSIVNGTEDSDTKKVEVLQPTIETEISADHVAPSTAMTITPKITNFAAGGNTMICFAVLNSETYEEIASAFTDNDGVYSFNAPAATGTYVVRASLKVGADCATATMVTYADKTIVVGDASVKIEVKTAAPYTVGSTVTVKATPTNLNSPTYTFYVKSDSDPVRRQLQTGAGTTVNYKINSEDTYTFTVEAEKDHVVYTASVSISSTEKKMYMKYAWNNSYWEWKEMAYEGNGLYTYYEATVSKYYTDKTTAQVCDNNTAGTGDGDHTIQAKGSINNGDVVTYLYNKNRDVLYAIGTGYYRVKSVTDYGTFYSNEFEAASAEGEDPNVSYFATVSGTQTVETLTAGEWVETANTVEPATANGIQVAKMDGSGNVADVKKASEMDYPLSIYHLNDTQRSYGTTNTMTDFTETCETYYDHYFMTWCDGNTDPKNTGGDPGKTKEVGATVGNSINHCLANMLNQYTLEANGNVRFEYSAVKNKLSRTVIQNGNEAIHVYGENIYEDAAGAKPCSGPGKNKNFTDGGNWVYNTIIYVNKPVGSSKDIDAYIMSSWNSKNYWPLAESGLESANDASKKIVGGNSTEGSYRMVMYYDYKTNKLTAGWYIVEGEYGTQVVDADIIFLRKEDKDVQQVTLESPQSEVSSLQKVVFAIQLDGSVGKSGERMFLFSLPFDCKISDIYGIKGNYMDSWGIQRYNGAKRAEIGWFKEDGVNFWEWIYDKNYVLKAGEGYSLDIDCSMLEWHNGEDPSGYKGEYNYIFFPSIVSGFTMNMTDEQMTITYAPMRCEIDKRNDWPEGTVGRESRDRRAYDSNWRLIGAMSCNNIKIKQGNHNADVDDYTWTQSGDDEHHKAGGLTSFIYVPHMTANGFIEWYEPFAPADTTIRAFYANFVQFEGTINWKQYTQLEQPQALAQMLAAPRRAVAAEGRKATSVRLNLLSNNEELDRTYVKLTKNGTEGFDFNADLTKIVENRSQIWTVSENTMYAGNTLPIATDTVAVVVKADKAGDYKIALDKECAEYNPVLYDKFEQRFVSLNVMDYDVFLDKGTEADRFYLIFSYKAPEIVTSVESVAAEGLAGETVKTQKLLINGQLYLLRDGRLYDATGKRAE